MRRIYRHACLLRARGHGDEADEIEGTELDHAIAHAREAADAVNEDKLLADEAERVAQACVMAELIAPLVVDRLRAEISTLAKSATSFPAPAAPPAASNPRPAPAPATPPANGAPHIADLIEGMLAQQRPRTAHARP